METQCKKKTKSKKKCIVRDGEEQIKKNLCDHIYKWAKQQKNVLYMCDEKNNMLCLYNEKET